MQIAMLGRIFTWIGVLSLFYACLMALGIVPYGFLFNIVADGALDGAFAFFLGAIAFFLYPEAPAGDETTV